MKEQNIYNYLRHLLRLAGTELPLFEPPAVAAIYQATQGVPRRQADPHRDVDRLAPFFYLLARRRRWGAG